MTGAVIISGAGTITGGEISGPPDAMGVEAAMAFVVVEVLALGRVAMAGVDAGGGDTRAAVVVSDAAAAVAADCVQGADIASILLLRDALQVGIIIIRDT